MAVLTSIFSSVAGSPPSCWSDQAPPVKTRVLFVYCLFMFVYCLVVYVCYFIYSLFYCCIWYVLFVFVYFMLVYLPRSVFAVLLTKNFVCIAKCSCFPVVSAPVPMITMYFRVLFMFEKKKN